MRMIDADALSRIVKLAWDTSDSKDFEKSVFIAIATAPTIEERKKGKWIDMGDFEQCSVCLGTRLKEIQTFYGKAIWIKTDFCPNCGADMRGDVNEAD